MRDNLSADPATVKQSSQATVFRASALINPSNRDVRIKVVKINIQLIFKLMQLFFLSN